MAYRTRAKMGVEVLRFQGDLNASEMIKIKERLTRLMNKNHKKMILDLKEARQVELAGLGILVDRLMKVRAQKGDIKLFNMRPEVEKTFRMIGVNDLMESFGTEEEAIRSFVA
jgi:anti-anti-sigma factor